VKQRVEGWLGDTLAAARVERGLPNPYFREVESALEEGMREGKGASPAELGVRSPLEPFVKSYVESVKSYGKTGNPGLPTQTAPTQSEDLRRIYKDSPEARAIIALAQAAETVEGLKHRGPFLSLTFELHQSREGVVLETVVLSSSGNKSFDNFVLSVVPPSLAKLRPPPADVTRAEKLSSVWRVDGRLRHSERVERVLREVNPGIAGVALDPLLEASGISEMRMTYSAHLLKAY
jgi:hypothetical protein